MISLSRNNSDLVISVTCRNSDHRFVKQSGLITPSVSLAHHFLSSSYWVEHHQRDVVHSVLMMMTEMAWMWVCPGHLSAAPLDLLAIQFQESRGATLCGTWGILVIPVPWLALQHTRGEALHCNHHYRNSDPVCVCVCTCTVVYIFGNMSDFSYKNYQTGNGSDTLTSPGHSQFFLMQHTEEREKC